MRLLEASLQVTEIDQWCDLVQKACVVLFWAVVNHTENKNRADAVKVIHVVLRVISKYRHDELAFWGASSALTAMGDKHKKNSETLRQEGCGVALRNPEDTRTDDASDNQDTSTGSRAARGSGSNQALMTILFGRDFRPGEFRPCTSKFYIEQALGLYVDVMEEAKQELGRRFDVIEESQGATTGVGLFDCDRQTQSQTQTVKRNKTPLVCASCGKCEDELGESSLLQCSACTIAPLYCSVACQRASWSAHKAECRANKK